MSLTEKPSMQAQRAYVMRRMPLWEGIWIRIWRPARERYRQRSKEAIRELLQNPDIPVIFPEL